MSWRDENYFRRWEQGILVKLRSTDPVQSFYYDDIKSPEEDCLPKVENHQDPVCIKFKKTRSYTSVKRVKGSRQFCDSCDFVAKRDRPFQRHQFEEHGRSLCGDCGRNFTDFRTFYKHILTHYDWVICPHCPKQFPTTRRLNRHIEVYHEGNERRRIEAENAKAKKACHLCGDLISTNNLSHHMKHRHSAPSTCPHCGKVVKVLQRHIERTQCNLPEEQRVKLKVELCKFCNKFIQKITMKKHIKRMHTAIDELQCDMCQFKTKHPFNLAMHKKRIHEHKSIKENCPKCNQECFNIEWHLSTYHTDER